MRDIFILSHFDLLGVDDDEFHVGRTVVVEERGKESVHHDGFTRASGTGDEKVGHFGEVGDDGIAGDVFSYCEG